jgi:Type III restriction enzyme, res subunit.
MRDVFKILADKHKTGFCPIQMPTGSGKTHSVLEFIYNHVTSQDDRRIIFITSMKKNLPEKSLRKIFEKNGNAKLFDETFLFLDSKEQTVIDNYKDWMRDAIDRVIEDKDLISDFIGLIESITRLKKSDTYKDKNTDTYLREQLRNRVEPAFRFEIRRCLGQFKGYNEKYDAVLNDPSWNWVSKLYPEVRTRDCKIIYMSADKFVMKNDTLVEKSYLIYDSELVENSIIFIDEFDSTKKTILNREIEMSISRNLDYMKATNQIYEGLNKINKHPEKMYVLSDVLVSSGTDPNDLKNFGESVKEEFKRVFEKYNLEYQFIMEMGPDVSDFLFYGHTSYYFTKGENKYLSTEFDKNERVNVIKESDNKEDMYRFYDMFRELENIFRFFFSFVRKIAFNCKIIQICKSEPIGYEYCIKSVLNIFKFDSNTVDYFTSEILAMQSSEDKRNRAEDGSIYERGFSVYNLKNETEHLYNSAIRMVSHNIMPEKILLRICSNAFVFGVSATATLDTVTGNYDLIYIKTRLKDNYIELDDEMITRLRTQFNRSVSGYDGNVEVDIQLISTSDGNGEYDPDAWNTLCPDAFYVKYIQDLLNKNDCNSFHKARYLKIAIVYHRFLLNKDILSLLCFLNKHPRIDDDELNEGILKSILNIICSCYKDDLPKEFSVEKSLFFLSGDDYDENKDNLLKRLSDKEKIFVITAYNTLGAGQNIQYPVKSQDGLVRINDFPLITDSEDGRPLEKDFDAIYLDLPRNVIPFATKNRKTKNIIEQIAITELLYERGDITISDESKCIKFAFSNKEVLINICKKICINTASANNQAAGQVIQAVGRICRTSLKNPKIYIFADEELKSIFNKKPEYYGELLNYETRKLIEVLSTPREDDKLCSRLISKGENRSKRAMGYINKLRWREWLKEDVDRWEYLRDHVLKHPTTSDVSDDITYQFYMEVPDGITRYWYSTNNDFRTIDLSFDNDLENGESVSIASARLEELMQIPGIRNLFEEKNYATSFETCKFMLSPPLFNNIYKGALGEVVGKRIIEDRCGISLIPLENSEYERFDFKTEGEKIYFDFKHWNSSGFVDSGIYGEIFKKMKDVGAEKVFVINILKPRTGCNDVIRSREEKGMKIIEVPYLYDAEADQWNKEAIFGINKEMIL